jgi:homoserine kinase type II
MAVYTELSSETIGALVRDRYGLGELAFAVGIAEGVENTNYLCVVTDGPIGEQGACADKRYILTIYEQRVSPDTLPFFMNLMTHAAAKGVPCPLPVPTTQGEELIRIGEKHAALISFLSGKSRASARNRHIVALGEAVAHFHNALDDFPLSRPNDMGIACWRNMYDVLIPSLDTVQEGLSDAIGRELDWLERHWPHHLPKGIIHADMFPDNVFFEQGRVSGIIDFYFACTDIRVYELAILLNAWCFEWGAELNLTKAQLLIRHYQKIRPISDDEMAALPTLCRGAALRFLLTRAYDALHTKPDALVTVKDPMEYVKKLEFHQHVRHQSELGL